MTTSSFSSRASRLSGLGAAFGLSDSSAPDTASASGRTLARWRPAWEAAPAALSAVTAAVAALLPLEGSAPGWWATGTSAALAGLSIRRGLAAWSNWRRRAMLAGCAPLFMGAGDVAARLRAMAGREAPAMRRTGLRPADAWRDLENAGSDVLFDPRREPLPESLWFGLGFEWRPPHAQRLYELAKTDWRALLPPPFLLRRLSADPGLSARSIGLPILHGCAARGEEAPIEVPLSALGGGTVIIGTTQSGKGVMFSALITQILARGEPVIVIDPKNSGRLREAVSEGCRHAARSQPLVLDSASPQTSVRFNPIAAYSGSAQIASRIRMALAGGSGSSGDVFADFAWSAVDIVAGALLYLGRSPTFAEIEASFGSGLEPLLIRTVGRALAPRFGNAAAASEAAAAAAPRDLEPPFRGSDPEAARLVWLWEHAVPEAERERPVAALVRVWRQDPAHYAKITASLGPLLAKLCAPGIRPLLSPDPDDPEDDRPIATLERIVKGNEVFYLALNSLMDADVASAAGAALLADAAALAGRLYAEGASGVGAKRIWLFIDEAANIMNDAAIELLNKGMEAGINVVAAMQTAADLEVRLGSAAKARQALGNFNNVVLLRTKDMETARLMSEAFGRTAVAQAEGGVSGSADGSFVPSFAAGESRRITHAWQDLIPLDMLGKLPNAEFFALLAGGRLLKGRMPILIPTDPGRRLFDEAGSLLPVRAQRALGAFTPQPLKTVRTEAA